MGTVYEMNPKGLAQYLADLKFFAKYQSTQGEKGERINREGSRYAMKIDSLVLENQSPKLSVFLEADGTIQVDIYSGTFAFFVVTEELSTCYAKGTKSKFPYRADSYAKRITIWPPKDGSYTIDAFDQAVYTIINVYEDMLNEQIGLAREEDDWDITPLSSSFHRFKMEYYTYS